MKLHQLRPGPPGDWEPVPADKLIAGTPATRTAVQYETADAKLSAGLWEASVGKWRIAYSEWEYVVMLSGRCVVTGDDGAIIAAGPGDSFVIEPGFTGTWEVTEDMAKRWVIKE